jgi:hypothetical protein
MATVVPSIDGSNNPQTSHAEFVPDELRQLDDPQRDLPRIAKDRRLTDLIESAISEMPTRHILRLGDARTMGFLDRQSVHLVVTSPPYWTLKEYRKVD